MDDVKMMKMQTGSPTTQRRVLSGASRKQQHQNNNNGVFQNDLVMLQRGSPMGSAGPNANAGSSRGQQAAAIGGYGNIFQNDMQMMTDGSSSSSSRQAGRQAGSSSSSSIGIALPPCSCSL